MRRALANGGMSGELTKGSGAWRRKYSDERTWETRRPDVDREGLWRTVRHVESMFPAMADHRLQCYNSLCCMRQAAPSIKD